MRMRARRRSGSGCSICNDGITPHCKGLVQIRISASHDLSTRERFGAAVFFRLHGDSGLLPLGGGSFAFFGARLAMKKVRARDRHCSDI